MKKIEDFKLDLDYLPTLYSNFFVGDIESSLNENNEWNFELICISDGYKVHSFWDLDECIDWLLSRDFNITLYFHNLDFDMLFFFKNERFKSLMENCPLINSGNLTLGFKVQNIEFRNSLSLFPMSLKKVVSVFTKIDDKEWLEDKSNVLDLEKDQLVNYCSKDCIYLHNALLKFTKYFKDNWDIDQLKLTTPSMALHVFKKNFAPKDFFELNRRNEQFFSSGYYFGGHTEKFVNDKKVFRGVYYYDVNSLYPTIMKSCRFIDSKLKRTFPTMKNLKKLIRQDRLFYCEVVVNIDSEQLRFFPVLDEEKKVNLYPFGEHTLKLSEVGVKFLLEYGDWSNIVKVNHILIGEENKEVNLFDEYVTLFYGLRKSDYSNDMIFKLLLNSLYGKFGQKNVRDIKVVNSTRDAMPKSTVDFDGVNISTYEEEAKFFTRKFNRLDVAGKITESARLLMGGYMNKIRKYGEVYYTDTDSIMTNVNMEENEELKELIDDKKLGYLSDEIGYKDNLILLGQKMYHFYKSGKKATKGIKNMDLNHFRGVIRGDKHFSNQRFSRFNSLVNRGFHGIQVVPYELKNIRERLDK